MNPLHLSVVALLCSVLLCDSAFAQGLDAAALRRKREDQERAQAMTRALLDGILSVQLRQLEDNGLTDLPAYREIGLMRSHLEQVIDEEMSQVVATLTTAQSAPPADRDAAFIAARQTIRDIVVQLSAERQGLLKRLKIAELSEQVQRLAALQVATLATTTNIATEAKSQQETLTLSVQEDQRDVKQLLLHLVDTLTDVQTWGGAVSATAADGLRILKAAEVGRHADEAVIQLQVTRLDTAVTHQAGVARGLEELLRLIQRNQGLLSGENREVLNRLRAIVAEQERVRAETRRLPPEADAPAELVEQQTAVRRGLAELTAMLPAMLPAIPAADQFAAQAAKAADTATRELFDGHQPKALEQQSQVLGNLAALENVLAQGSTDPQTDRSAAELARQVLQLQDTKAKLQAAAEKQQQALDAAPNDVAQSKALEPEIAEQVAAAKTGAELPVDVTSAIDSAEQAARSAVEALQETSAEATDAQMQSLRSADRALDRAVATVEAALQETQRLADAVKIGELARAAEALERAAAEERDIIRQLRQADEMTAAEAEPLQQRQSDVAAIADKVREALQEIAPAGSERVAQAAQSARNAEQKLQAAAQSATPVLAAKSAIEPATTTAEQLSAAAGELRQQVQQAAQALAERSASQAARLSDAADAVENAKSPAAMSLVDQIAQLQEARKTVATATQQQQQASGRPEAAAAMELAADLADAAALQQAADRAAAAYDRGESATPLAATTAQQQAADALQTLSAQARSNPAMTPEMASALEQAETAAAKAARQMLDGQSQPAAASRQEATRGLNAARQQAETAADRARQAVPTARPDAAAQTSAAETAALAQSLSRELAPTAASLLESAADLGRKTAQQIAEDRTADVSADQRRTEDSLMLADRQLQNLLQQLRAEQAQSLAAQADQIAPLVAPTAPLETGAAAALEAAETAARAGASPEATSDAQSTAAMSAERQLDRAAATLSAKAQQLRRDQAVAEALANLAGQQQESAAMLAEQRQQAMQQAETADPAAAPTVNTEQAAKAAEQFAEAQRATGQGAVELSGQQQVANPPLRDALQMAADLPTARLAQAARQMAQAAAMAAEQAMSDLAHADPSQAAAPGDPNDPNADSGNDDAPGQPGQASPSGRTPQSPPASDTGFVPQSPELTAQLLAGPELTQAMQAAADAQQSHGQPTKPSDGTASQRQQANLDTNSTAQPSPNDAASTAQGAQQTAKQSGETQNDAIKDGPLQKQPEGTEIGDSPAGRRSGDADAAARAFEDQPWFAKLPPELRKSIRAGMQQKAPRAYEDRLRRYFQSVD